MRVEGEIVYVFDHEEDRQLRSVVESYVMRLNGEKSMELGRDLKPEEKFHANIVFARVLEALDISKALWWS